MSDDQIFWILGLWVHWIMPVLFIAMMICFAMAILVKIFPPKNQVRPKKEDKGS
jgi:predicted MFS family arabinose efflux permease